MITITDAAIKCIDGLFTYPGTKYRHRDIIQQTVILKRFSFPYTEGFMTSDGRFVNRCIAADIAFNAGQIKKPTASLTTEDLW